MGPLRHSPCRVPAGANDARATRGGLLARRTATSTRGGTSREAPRPRTRGSDAAVTFAYSAGWKKFERVWDAVIQAKRLGRALPLLESVLSGLGRLRPSTATGIDIPAVEPESHQPEDGQPVRLSSPRIRGGDAPEVVVAGGVSKDDPVVVERRVASAATTRDASIGAAMNASATATSVDQEAQGAVVDQSRTRAPARVVSLSHRGPSSLACDAAPST